MSESQDYNKYILNLLQRCANGHLQSIKAFGKLSWDDMRNKINTNILFIVRLKRLALRNPYAMNILALMYQTGFGVKIDIQSAKKLYQKAASCNLKEAMHNLGAFYQTGQGITIDDKISFQWFLRAATLNCLPSMHIMGIIFYRESDDKNSELALQWFKRAAINGQSESMAYLGDIYSAGRGIEKNYELAFDWYTKGAAKNNKSCLHGGYGAGPKALTPSARDVL